MGAVHSHKITPPRASWKWEYSPNLFASYPSEASLIIERHFLAGFTEPFQVEIPNSPPLTIDLTQLVQTCPQSNRRIIREINQDLNANANALWSWENDFGEMEPYPTSVSNNLETYYKKKGVKFAHIKIEGSDYWIDFVNHCQISLGSMRKRRIDRNIIPDHKFIWQWQADTGEFVNYLDSISRKIETDYFLNPDFPQAITISGQKYYIDTKRMCEINESDGKERQIRRILESYVRHKWYWKDELEIWHPFSSCLVDKFEAHYLNPCAGPFSICIDYTEYEIDIKTMTEKAVLSGKIYPIKRQPLPNDFPVWGWTTKPGVFKTFSPSVSKLIENHYILNDPTPLNIEVQDKKYSINIRRRVKLNTLTKKQKILERKLISNNYPPNLDFLSIVECQKIFKFLAQYGYLPQEWDYNQREEAQSFSASDSEWSLISEKISKTIDFNEWLISSLSRFQNIMLINMFMLNKTSSKICHRNLEEPELLFFIANKEEKIDLLENTIENPLEGRFSPLKNFGKGYYFTKSMKTCKDYAWEAQDGTKTVICFWVLPGKTVNIKEGDDLSTLYNGKYNTWDDVRRAPIGADCSKVTVNDEEMLVVYNTERCYPLYIIELKNLNE